MTVEQDFDAVARELNQENVREDNTLGRTIEDMRIQLRVLQRQRRARRGYHPPTHAPPGASGPTGPATGP